MSKTVAKSKSIPKTAKSKTTSGAIIASSNWVALQKKLNTNANPDGNGRNGVNSASRKRRKIGHGHQGTGQRLTTIAVDGKESSNDSSGPGPSTTRTKTLTEEKIHFIDGEDVKNGESLSALRRMILGEVEGEGEGGGVSEDTNQPGKYLAIDCEMVGIGIDGSESSLARVSIVNYFGAVVLDEFVRQRERVVDYRTQWSGIRERDMIHAKPFDEIQRRVAELIKDRILIGHAVYNDLKALLLSHPWPLTRDTQYFAGKFKVVRSKYVALRNLVKQELDVVIQSGEHSSLTDARATMAVYRLHRKEWEKGSVSALTASLLTRMKGKGRQDGVDDSVKGREERGKGKRKRNGDGDEDGDEDGDGDRDDDNGSIGFAYDNEEPSAKSVPKPKLKSKTKIKTNARPKAKLFPGGGRKGVSSGLSTVVTRIEGKRGGNGSGGRSTSRTKTKSSSSGQQWWKKLGE
ncbi:hypothetical protein GYMLUDRAFT_43508 [Collybiopsis luxurians FD-317 M1]|uniref:RNA exonuclease 4 n=1 Tax=Collybiopsis luxurians FD-317 M1 TaxID=944289 RepID=A0A0D0CEL3_9AGAR|nr:hypothetical protein GYMLUDRAFT_43508 [Collybiopsis luxurians FD-317 M1]